MEVSSKFFEKLHKISHLGVPICLLVFLVNYVSNFDYYKQDQTRNPMTCCATFYPEKAYHTHRLLYEYINFLLYKESVFRRKKKQR